MKKLIIIQAFLFSSICVFSQLDFGLRAGLSSSQVEINETVNGLKISTGDNTFGYHIGAFTKITFKDKFVIMPEVLFSSTGGEIDLSNGTNFNEIWNLTYNRMDIPLNFGVKFLKIFRLSAGPYASILLSADARSTNIEKDVTDNYKDVLWGYQAGLGVDIWRVLVDLKYEGSFHSYHNENIPILGTEKSYSPDSRPNQWILSVGFKLF